MKKTFCLLLTLFGLLFVSATTFDRYHPDVNVQMEGFLTEQRWVDSIFQVMTPEQRLGQLVWVRAQSDWGEANDAAVERLIKDYHIGGVCFFNPSHKGTPEKEVELTNRYQALAQHVPLFVTLDAEWGVGWRYRDFALSFPRQMMLGAVQDEKLIYRMGEHIARHLLRIGVTINFAPVADVNNNAANPVINFRSFGENPRQVANRSYLYMKGMQDNGVMACAKHFPGHGDTGTDSHYDLPVIRHSRERLDSVELFPFDILFKQGIGSVMVAHLSVPALDPTKNLPTTLSRPVVTDLLKNKMNFNGLVMTDALEMKGVTKYHGPGEVEALALAAGNDVLLLPSDVQAGFRTVKKWLADGRLQQADIDHSVRKVLHWKYRMGLNKGYQPIDTANLAADLNDAPARALRRQLIVSAMTLARDEGNLVPLSIDLTGPENMAGLGTASLAIGTGAGNDFQRHLNFYKKIESHTTGKEISSAQQASLLKKLGGKELVIVSLHDMSQNASSDFGITKSTRAFLEKLNQQTKVVLVVFGNPYSLKYFDGIGTVLVAYEEANDIQDIAAQALFGAFAIQGRLPVSASPKSQAGMGVVRASLQRLGYGLPEEVGMSSAILQNIDSVMQDAMEAEATPGGVVLVARQGKVVFWRAYGKHTYSSRAEKTRADDIFDLASVTKIAATTVSLMHLQELGLFEPNDPAKKYLPEFANTNKADIPIAEMLTHRAQLTTWIKFYEETIDSKKQPSSKFYRKKAEPGFTLPVAKDLYLRDDWPDTIWQRIVESPLLERKEYRYSDLAFYIAAEIVKRQSGQPLEDYVQQNFYRSMGMETTGFQPLYRFPLDRIPPTEDDNYWRQREVQGYTHDMGAAMLNQVSGHAGLFSNANDLAKMMQMLLNRGEYGGVTYFRPETVHRYTTRCPDCTRRGLGFDMLQLDERFEPNLSTKASKATFGHLGFTGIAAWADPDNELVYIFLSNRTFPSMHNNKLGKMNTRVLAMDVVYESLVE